MSNDQLQQHIQNFLTSFGPWLINFNQYYNEDEDQVLGGGGAGAVTKRESWSQHEEHVYEMIKQAALRVAAETCSEVHVIRPKQPHSQGCQIQNLKISSSLRKIRSLSGEFFSKISRKIRKFSFWDLRSK